jgi:hypothetical protein
MRFPTTFECRPTAPGLPIHSLPDELMIDWSSVPEGATASVFLPAADAASIKNQAAGLYGGQSLKLADAHTLVCEASGITFIPIPAGASQNYAGLLTVNVPRGFARACNVIARQITNLVSADERPLPTRRKVLGAFEFNLSPGPARALREPEERLLAYFRWIMLGLADNDRWRPVIERYVAEIADRVRVFGGEPGSIEPSQVGALGKDEYVTPAPGTTPLERTGKIEGLVHDRFGDFEAFILQTESGQKVTFQTRERHFVELVIWSWRTQNRITVFSTANEPQVPDRIVLHAPLRSGLFSP